MTTRRLVAATALLVAAATTAVAQRTPDGWRWQLDRAAENVMGRDAPAGAWQFQEMIPGMHVTSGPGVLLIAPGDGASGRFMVDADLLLFPNSTNGGYGIVVGARAEGGSTRVVASQWTAFLVSGKGEFAVVRHVSGKSTPLIEWRAHEAVAPKGADVVTNRARVSVDRDSVRFIVNGKPVVAVASAVAQADGMFGLRFDEGVNLHVTNVDFVRRLLRR